MIISHTCYAPKIVEFGIGSINKLNEMVKSFASKEVLVLTDKGIRKAGLVDKISDILTADNLGFIVNEQCATGA